MEDTVVEEDVGLRDCGGDIARRHILASRVDGEGERLAVHGRVVL